MADIVLTGDDGSNITFSPVDVPDIVLEAQDTPDIVLDGAISGPPGREGNEGPPGQGVSIGGVTGQVLAKKSAADYDTEWVDQSVASSTAWGDITGTLSNQADLQTALGSKVDKIAGKGLSTNDFTDSDKTIVANTSGVNTGDQDLSGYALVSEIPTNNASLANGAGYITGYTETDPVYTASEAANITASDITKLGNLSGINTGDETVATIKSKLGITTLSGSNTGDQIISDVTISTSDVTTNNVSTTKHGFAPKLPNDATKYLDGTGAYSTPVGGSGVISPLTTKGDVWTYSTTDTRIGVGVDGQVLTADSTQATGLKWDTPAGTGDMLKSIYDPNSVNANVFSQDNMVDGTTNKNYTATEKTKLAGIATGAEVNVQSDWNEAVTTADDYIKNKPTIPTNNNQLTNGAGYITSYTETDPVFSASEAANITATDITNLGNLSGINTGDQTTITGNAGTATKLQTARAIGGVSFDGSADINLPGVNTTGNQNTTGSAATLTTGRTINGVSFNGSANITVPGLVWTAKTASFTAAANNGYIANAATLVVVTLPTTAAVGTTIRVAGMGAGGWKIAQNTGQQINFGSMPTTTGTGGSLASGNQYDAAELVCIVANTTWVVVSSQGNITVA